MADFNPNQGFRTQSKVEIYSTNGTKLLESDPENNLVVIGPSFNPVTNIDPGIPLYIVGTHNNYFGFNVVNLSGGVQASADVICLASQQPMAQATTFVDLGIVNDTQYNYPTYAIFSVAQGYVFSGDTSFYVGTGGTGSNGDLFFFTGGLNSKNFIRGSIDANGNWFMGRAALATTATNGFLNIPTCAGTPTGTPTLKTGLVPMVYDTTNNIMYIYNGGGWKKSSTFTA